MKSLLPGQESPSSAWTENPPGWRLRLHTSMAFLADAEAPDDSSAVLAAIYLLVIHNCKSFNGVRNCS